MNIYRFSILITVATLVAAIYTIFTIAPDMQLPIHWGISGQADKFTDASTALLFPALTMLGVVVLVPLLKFIEPRRENIKQSRLAIDSIVAAIVMFMLMLELGYFALIAGYEFSMTTLIMCSVGVLFMVLGNFLGKTRSNFYIGIRTPWTLSSDEVWRKTHRLGGPLFMIAGAVLSISVWFFAESTLGYIVLATALPAALIPTIYSWWLYRNLEQSESKSDLTE